MKKITITSYEEAISYIFSVPKFTTKNSMEDTRAFLRKLGSPDKDLHIIHVAGTNGKGSVCSYMKSVFKEAGMKVAVFTSPHLVDVRERFMVDGEMVSEEAFLEAFMEVYNSLDWAALEVGEGYHPTFFEFLFFVALLLFVKEKPDVCILETGLGGRLDATNSVSKKELSVITRIGLDHVEYLGDTLEKIAGEKAGIMMAGVPLVYADTCEEVSGVYKLNGKQLSCPLYGVSKDDYRFLGFANKNIDFSYVSRYDKDVVLRLPTIALYQMENASLALRALQVWDQENRLSEEVLRKGIESSFWAGRMEEVLPDIFVDGAHNEDGIRAFLETVKADGYDGKRKLLFSVVSDKDYEKMLQMLLETDVFEEVVLTHLENARGASIEVLEQIAAKGREKQIKSYPSVKEALNAVRRDKGDDERVYIAGSLYLVGEIKEYLRND